MCRAGVATTAATRSDYVDDAQIAELEAALNRLDPLVVRRALDALRNHPLRRSFRVLSFATGAASSADLGVEIQLSPDANYTFRVTYSESAGGFELSGSHFQTSFSEVTLSPDSMKWFAEAILDVLRRQGFHG